MFFFKNYAENKAERLVPDLFLFCKKKLIWGESKLDYWSRDMLNFNFSEKGLELVSPPNFV